MRAESRARRGRVLTLALVLGVDDESLVMRRDVDLLRAELTHVETQTKHLPASASAASRRTVVEHVAEIHLLQQVLTAPGAAHAHAMPVVRRLQPEEVASQA